MEALDTGKAARQLVELINANPLRFTGNVVIRDNVASDDLSEKVLVTVPVFDYDHTDYLDVFGWTAHIVAGFIVTALNKKESLADLDTVTLSDFRFEAFERENICDEMGKVFVKDCGGVQVTATVSGRK